MAGRGTGLGGAPAAPAPPAPGRSPSERRRLDWFWLGCAAAVLAAVVQSLAFAATSGLLSSADEAAHLDYAYQVWTGRLPVFEDGLVLQPGFGQIPPVQWASQHPPLYYAILAPAVGPLVDNGHIVAAGYAARALNALIAGAVVVALVWGTRQLLPSMRSVALVAGVVAASNSWIIRVGGSVYNDGFATLWAALLIGMTVRIIRRGVDVRRAAVLAVFAAGGVLSRASLGVILFLCLAALVLWAPPRNERRRWLPARTTLVAAVAVGLATVAAAGWFYLRNLRLTGSIIGGDPEWAAENLGREPRPILDMLLDPVSLERLYGLFSYGQLPPGVSSLVLLVLPLLLGVVTLARGWSSGQASRRRERHAVAGFLALTVGVVLVQQLMYSAGGGGLNPRYLMPILLPLVALMALGLLSVERLRAVPVIVWAALVQVDFVLFVVAGLDGPATNVPSFPGAGLALALAGAGAMAVACTAVVRGLRRVG